MNKYSADEVVLYEKDPGLFVIFDVNAGYGKAFYSLVRKGHYDAWDPDKLEPPPPIAYNKVPENELQKIQ